MTTSNPSNPYTSDEGQTQRETSLPILKATVESADAHPDEGGFHTVKVSNYNNDSPYTAHVIPPTIGSAWVPKPGMDVAVMHGPNDKPWIVGPWYPVDRVASGEIEIPDYEPGELVLGNSSGGYFRLDNDGNIHLSSSEDGSVYIDGVEQ